MRSVFDELELIIECPSCGTDIKTQTARIKRAQAVRCEKCGRIDVNGHRIQQLVAGIKDAERRFADLGSNLRFTLE